ncbi:MAG: hypothetical protein ACLQED_15915 [Desulfobaccales bacterium]
MAKRAINLFVLIILFMALPIAASGGSDEFKPGSEPDGFRGIKWGTDILTLRGMELIKDGGLEKYYKKREDNLTIGASHLSDITYVFRGGKFVTAIIRTKGDVNYGYLKDACFEKFGKGWRTAADEKLDIQSFAWFGDATWVSLKYEKVKDEGVLTFSQIPKGGC